MKINIQQSNITEHVSKNIIDALYNIFKNNLESDNQNSLLVGRIEVNYEYEKYINFLENLFNRLNINVNKEFLIWFNDKNVESVLINNIDQSNIGGIPISYKIDLSNIQEWFRDNENISEFNELEQFKNIKTLQSYAFNNCANLTEIDLSNIETINLRAFENSGISGELCLPNIKYLGGESFKNCKNITSITNLGTLTTFQEALYGGTGYGPFVGCSGLISVTLPETFTIINRHSFISCTSLTTIYGGINVTEIHARAFQNCTNLENIGFFNNISRIDGDAFRNCLNLNETLSLPNLTGTLGAGAFRNCKKIKYVENLGECSSFDSAYEGGYMHGPFSECTSLISINLPATLTKLGQGAFMSCTSLTIIDLTYVTIIDKHAFRLCTSLTTVNNSNNVTEINQEAFNGCKNLKHIDLSNIQTLGFSCFDGTALEGDICMPRLQQATGSFYGTNITSVSNLGSIMNLQSSRWTGRTHGLFQNCTLLKSVKLPETVTILDAEVFSGCTSLETINFPLSITTLNSECLEKLTAIKDTLAYFPNVITVGNFVFSGSNYQYVYLNNLEEPSTDGYYSGDTYHRGLFMTNRGDKTYKLIYLKKIKYLPAGTFGRCQINYVIINNETPPELLIDENNSNAFTASTVTFIVVPDNAVQTYKEDTDWAPYSNKIIGLSTMNKVITREQFDEKLNNGDSTIYLIEEYM